MLNTRRLLVVPVALLGLLATVLVAAPAQAGDVPISEVTVTKIVDGPGPSGPYDIGLECAGNEDLVSISDGESETVDFNSENVNNGCSVYELDSMGASSVDVVVFASNGEQMEVTQYPPPDFADAAFSFEGVNDMGLDYYVTVINTFPQTGDAAALCSVVLDAALDLSAIAEAFEQIGTISPAELEVFWTVLETMLLDGLDLTPPEVAAAWESATVDVLTIGSILETVGYDVALLSPEHAAAIADIVLDVGPHIEDIFDWVGDNCYYPEPTSSTTTSTTAAAAAAVTTPRFTG